jgi:hypothetical protein
MKISCLLTVLALLFALSTSPGHAKRAYMWTDEKGVHHISDQPPPKGVDTTSFSADREYPEVEASGSEPGQTGDLQNKEPGPKKTDETRNTVTSPSTTSEPDSKKAPKYRDVANLTREEQARIVVLKASEERTKQYYERASSEEDRRRWKAELDRIEAEAKKILEPKGR